MATPNRCQQPLGITWTSVTQPLSKRPLNAFDNSTIRTAVIRSWKEEDFLYTVFLRLNTGSVPLSPQELRQALHPGPFVSFVEEYSRSSSLLRRVMHLDKPDVRMRDAELVIRYYAFRNFLGTYTGNLKPLLDETAKYFNDAWQRDQLTIQHQREELEAAIEAVLAIFGEENAFRKWSGRRFERALNRAIFDVMVLYFIEPAIAEEATRRKQLVVESFRGLCVHDEQFKSSIEGTTKSIQSIYIRLLRWGQALSQVLQMHVPLPQLRENRLIIPIS